MSTKPRAHSHPRLALYMWRIRDAFDKGEVELDRFAIALEYIAAEARVVMEAEKAVLGEAHQSTAANAEARRAYDRMDADLASLVVVTQRDGEPTIIPRMVNVRRSR